MRPKDKDKIEELDFEIRFYEGLIKDNPNFIQALIALGDVYTKRGLYHKGLKIDQRLVRLKPDDPIVHYNLACSYSLVGKIDSSERSLKRAIELGYRNFDYMNNDPDLENLRKDSRFSKLLSKFKMTKA